jgi:hypothetical protein
MLEYVAYVVLGAVMVGGLLYVTMTPEMEDARKPRGHDPSNNLDTAAAPSTAHSQRE